MSGGTTAFTIGSTAVTLGEIGTVASLAGTAISAIGGIEQSQAQAGAAKYNASVAAANATIAQQSAAYAGAAGAAQTEQAQLQTRAKVGGIVANQAAGNIDVNSGSALDVRSSAQQLGELNALSVRSNAARTAYGYQVQAANDTAQSQLDTYGAQTSSTAGDISAFGTVLGGAGNAASNYAKFQLQSGNSLNGGGSSDQLFPLINQNQFSDNPTGTPGY